jgi:hypothetical protein
MESEAFQSPIVAVANRSPSPPKYAIEETTATPASREVHRTAPAFRYTQLLSSDVDVMDTGTQRGTNNGLSSVDKWTRTIDNGSRSEQRNIK